MPPSFISGGMILGSTNIKLWPCLYEVINIKTTHMIKTEIITGIKDTTVLTILFLLELYLFFDDTIKRIFYADTVNVGILVELQPGVNI
jgi:hypothetical protein